MTHDDRDEISEAALAWLVRLRSGTAEDWARFVEWLEADPAHQSAYDEAERMDALLDELPSEPRQLPAYPNVAVRQVYRRRAVLGLGVAAIVAASAGFFVLSPGRDLYAVAAAAGQSRTIAMTDGTQIDLNGSSQLRLDRDDPRYVELAEGEAFFRVAPDASSPFHVDAGSAKVTVLGTSFDMIRNPGDVEVSVAEGTVRVEAGPEPVKLSAGMVARTEGERLAVTRTKVGDVGSWRKGRLIYSAAPIGRVASDLSRSTGIAIEVRPDLADRKFSGVINVDRDHDLLRRRVSALLGVDVRQAGGGWLLTSASATD